MAKYKIPWLEAKLRYIMDEQLSFQDIANLYSISKRSVVARASKEQWKKQREKNLREVTQRFTEKMTETKADITRIHSLTGRLMLELAVQKLQSGELELSPKDVLRFITKGVEIQRTAFNSPYYQSQSKRDDLEDILPDPETTKKELFELVNKYKDIEFGELNNYSSDNLSKMLKEYTTESINEVLDRLNRKRSR